MAVSHVPVVLGVLGSVHAGIAWWLDIVPGHHNLQHLQKAVLLGSTQILRKVMSSVKTAMMVYKHL